MKLRIAKKIVRREIAAFMHDKPNPYRLATAERATIRWGRMTVDRQGIENAAAEVVGASGTAFSVAEATP